MLPLQSFILKKLHLYSTGTSVLFLPFPFTETVILFKFSVILRCFLFSLDPNDWFFFFFFVSFESRKIYRTLMQYLLFAISFKNCFLRTLLYYCHQNTMKEAFWKNVSPSHVKHTAQTTWHASIFSIHHYRWRHDLTSTKIVPSTKLVKMALKRHSRKYASFSPLCRESRMRFLFFFFFFLNSLGLEYEARKYLLL